MSALGWIAPVLAALIIALALRAMSGRSRRPTGESPRTVADLVRLRAAQAEPPSAPSRAVAVPEPRPAADDPPAVVEPVIGPPAAPADAAASCAPERKPAPARVSASADDTPWNRAARIAESDGIVWATDHDRPQCTDPAAGGTGRPEPVLRAVQLPAFPPELVDTRSTVPPAAPDDRSGKEPDRLDAEVQIGGDPAAAGAVSPAEPSGTGSDAGAAAPPAAEPLPAAADPADAADPAAAADADPAAAADAAADAGVAVAGQTVSEPVASAIPESGPAVAGSAVAESAAGESVVAESGGAGSVGAGSGSGSAVPVPSGSVAAEPVTAPESARPRRSPAEAAAEQAAADLALLRTFGCVMPGTAEDEPSTVALEGVCCAAATAETRDGDAQPVAFRVVGRDGAGVPGAGVTLLDDRGREAAGSVADAGGGGTVLAPRPGSYVLVSSAAGHQPGAVAITVAGEPVSADLLLARSASLSGTVHGEDGPVVGARLTLVQDGEIVDTAQSGPGGGYRMADLAAGEYGLSVTASECEPAAVLVDVPDETDARHDVELDPAGLKRPADDMMIGLG